MIRRTSAEAYRKLVESGGLARSEAEVYRYAYHHGPITRNQLDAALSPGLPNPTHSRRLSGLERKGLMCRVGEGVCPIKGQPADLWDVTDLEEPRRVPPQRSRKEVLETTVRQIRTLLKSGGRRVLPDATLETIEKLVDEVAEVAA